MFAIFDKVKASDLYKETFETLSGKNVDWDKLEYDKIKTIPITEKEFISFKKS